MAKGRVVGGACQSCFLAKKSLEDVPTNPPNCLCENNTLVVPLYSLDIQGHLLRFGMTGPEKKHTLYVRRYDWMSRD